MKKKILSTILVGACCASIVTGCGKQSTVDPCGTPDNVIETTEESDPSEETSETQEIGNHDAPEISNLDRNNCQNLAVIIDNLNKNGQSNAVISGLSLDTNLAMSYQGVGDRDISEYQNYFSGYSPESIRDYYSDLSLGYAYDDFCDVRIANSVWYNSANNISLNNDFIENMINYFYATLKEIDFNDPGSATQINDWCADATEDRIKEIISPSTLAENDTILIDALYFKGPWQDPFGEHDVSEKDFTNVDGTTSTVTMISGVVDTYFENNQAIAFAKDYEGGNFSFIGILPNDPNYKVSSLDIESLLSSETNDYDVRISMPKFQTTFSCNMVQPLKQVGFNNIFTSNADFSNMSSNNLYITEIIQKVYIDVNEDGTEAAAVTASMMKTNAAPEQKEFREVNLDRPFVFMIYDNVHDEVLFMGNMQYM